MNEYPGQRSRLFKDLSKLSFDYVPERLVHRETQWERMWMLFRPVLEGGASQTAFLIGSVGTGKTAMTKRFCLDFADEYRKRGGAIDFLVVNCRQRSSENAVLLRLVTHFDEGYPDRGFSSAEMLRAIRRHVNKKKLHLIVVLDEADVLLKKGSGDLIYNLSRFDEETVGGKGSISLILVSQRYVLDMLDPASLSTFRRANAINFDRYSSDELKDIITDRVELAFFQDTVRDDSLDLIADIASEWGDARFAIELLEKAGMLAEEEGTDLVDAEHVRAAKALTYSVVTESRIEELDTQRKVVLLAIARTMKDRAYVTTGEVEENYRIATEEFGERSRGHTQFWSYLQDLSNQGLIETKVAGDASGGRTTYISLPDIPSKVLRERLESLLE
ncbi:MAG: AAA family ATPase [Methanomassiliicoccales archaeon]|nr:AAA family ATPase [Methanomassiliicoccales archaeon]NYT15110.1 AAA family ATPase [Methanomassiliicoccales archaeon]